MYDLYSLQGITWWEKSFNNKEVLKLLEKQQSLNFIPNTKYLYSNTNYILLALIIEHVSKKSFVDFTSQMFSDLNMLDSSFEDNYSKIKGPIASAYFNFDSWITYDWIWNVCGDGNFFSTLEDQIHWEKIIQGKIKTKIKRKIIAKSQQLVAASLNKNYGFGLEFGQYNTIPYHFHEGATGAWKATVIRFPSKKLSVLTLTNSGKTIPSQQTRQMADVLLNIKENQNIFLTEPNKKSNYVSTKEIIGIYLNENDFFFEFFQKDETLFLRRLGRNDVALERESDHVFYQKFDPAFKQEFVTNEQGELEVTAYYTSHPPYTLKRKEYDWSTFDYHWLNGKYENTETNVILEIRHVKDKTYEVKFNSTTVATGILVAPTKLLVNGYSLHFEITNKDISNFLLQGDRIKNIFFKKV